MSATASTESVLGFAGLTMELAQIAGIESALLATVLALVCTAPHAWYLWFRKKRKPAS